MRKLYFSFFSALPLNWRGAERFFFRWWDWVGAAEKLKVLVGSKQTLLGSLEFTRRDGDWWRHDIIIKADEFNLINWFKWRKKKVYSTCAVGWLHMWTWHIANTLGRTFFFSSSRCSFLFEYNTRAILSEKFLVLNSNHTIAQKKWISRHFFLSNSYNAKKGEKWWKNEAAASKSRAYLTLGKG